MSNYGKDRVLANNVVALFKKSAYCVEPHKSFDCYESKEGSEKVLKYVSANMSQDVRDFQNLQSTLSKLNGNTSSLVKDLQAQLSRTQFNELMKSAYLVHTHLTNTEKDAQNLLNAFTKGKLKPQLFVSDDPTTWGGPHSKALISMKVSVKNPFVITKDDTNLEGRLNGSSFLKIVRANGHDAVIHTTVNDIVGYRQALLLQASKQVSDMKRIK